MESLIWWSQKSPIRRSNKANNVSSSSCCLCVLSFMGRGRLVCNWNWHLGTWQGCPGWWWWRTTRGRDGPPPGRWTASLLSSGESTQTQGHLLQALSQQCNVCMHKNIIGASGCHDVLFFSLCRPCPASSAARPCTSRQRWLTSGWVAGSDSSCQCAAAAGAAPSSRTWNKERCGWGDSNREVRCKLATRNNV